MKDNLWVPEIHENFRLDKQSYTRQRLVALALSYCSTGTVYQRELGEFIVDWLNDQDHIIVQTSGSTGVPKKIKVHKQHMVNSALATGRFFDVEKNTSALLCLSATYIAGKMMLVRAMVLGWKLDVVPPKTNPLEGVYTTYDFCAMVPLQLNNSIGKLHLVKKMIVGGGAVSKLLKNQLQGIKTKIYETYGMTETVTHIAARRINPKKSTKKETNYFKALSGIKLSTDDRGCLVINAPLLNTDIIITNDIVELISSTEFRWKGRFDNVINSGGVKLFPEEIEKKMQLLIRDRFFITSVLDDVLGDKVVLVIEKAYDQIYKELLFNTLNNDQSLDKYEIPKIICFISRFIETENGKLQRTKTLEAALYNSN